jgi:hypothetical protein
MQTSIKPLFPIILCSLTWRTSFFAHGGEHPSTLVPGLLSTAPPFASYPTLSHPTDQVAIFPSFFIIENCYLSVMKWILKQMFFHQQVSFKHYFIYIK